jgi:hypothetical protein
VKQHCCEGYIWGHKMPRAAQLRVDYNSGSENVSPFAVSDFQILLQFLRGPNNTNSFHIPSPQQWWVVLVPL